MMRGNHSLRDAALRIFIAGIRHLPVPRGKMRMLGQLLAARSEAFRDYEFRCPRGFNLVWSARGLPDLLTRHMLLDGFYQRDVMSALRYLAKPDEVVFDIGAHHGLMSVISAKTVGRAERVVAFEPNPFIQELLRHHLEINGVARVKREPCGMGDAEVQLPFYARQDAYAWNSSFTREFADPERRIEPVMVPVTTIDQYVERTSTIPNVIKIDTEGTEMNVLRGGRRTLSESRSKVVMELNPSSAEASGLRVADYIEFFHALNYGVFVLPRGRPATTYRICKRFEEAVDCRNGMLTNVVCLANEDPDLHSLQAAGV